MPIAKSRGFDMHYAEFGPRDRPAIVMLHGATETFDVGWRRLAPRLAKHFCVIGPDMRGHGLSENPSDAMDLREIADDVAALLDELELEHANVCGFSGGASAALFFGFRHPWRARSLTLISNNARLDEARMASNFWDPERLERDDPHWLSAMRRWHSAPAERILAWWAAEDRVRPNFSALELSEMQVPTLVVAGDRDPVVPLEQSRFLYEALPDTRLLVLPGVGHGAPYRAAVPLGRVIRGFIEEIESRAAGHANRHTK